MALKIAALILASCRAQEMTDAESDAIIAKRLAKRLSHQEVVNAVFPPTPTPTPCNADFVDSEGFDCQLYELGNWCNGTASTRGFGTEWCKRTSTCKSQGFNWGAFSGFAKKSEEADTQCAGCGASKCAKNYKRSIPDEPTGCVNYDTVAANGGGVWTDSWGYSCHAYHQGQFCKQSPDGTWSEGGLWPVADFGKITGYSWFHKGCESGKSCKIDAYTACCSCGGGKKSNQTSVIV